MNIIPLVCRGNFGNLFCRDSPVEVNLRRYQMDSRSPVKTHELFLRFLSWYLLLVWVR